MVLAPKHRDSLFRSLSPITGEEQIEALLQEFPYKESDEPATRGYVDLKTAEIHADIANLRADIFEKFHHHTTWIIAAVVGGSGLASTVVAIFG
jgi:hypothetical protein